MLPWRKLQAGFGGKGDVKDVAGVVQHITNETIIKAQEVNRASIYEAGVIEIATTAETTLGGDDTRAVSPEGLALSVFGEKIIGVLVEAGDTALATGNAKNGNYFRIPSSCNGWDIISVEAQVYGVGSTGTTDIQLRNVTDSVDVLSTKLTIDSGEEDSSTAAAPAVINTSNDDVATGDQFVWDVDAVQSTTAPNGLYCEAILRLP